MAICKGSKVKEPRLPLLYLCRSKLTRVDTFNKTVNILQKEFNADVRIYNGGAVYDAEREAKRILECDWMMVIGPSFAVGNDLLVGKGQMVQVNDFIRDNDYRKVLIIDEVTNAGSIYVSELTDVSIYNPNNFTDSYAKLETNHMYMNLTSVLDARQESPMVTALDSSGSMKQEQDVLIGKRPVSRLLVAKRFKIK